MSDSGTKLEIMDFWAEWCGPCHIMKPILHEVEEEYKGKLDLQKINVDEEPQLSEEYQVRSIPTMIFKKGGVIVDQVVGAIAKDQLVRKIDEHLA